MLMGAFVLEFGEKYSWDHRGWIAVVAGVVFAGVAAALIRFDSNRDTTIGAQEVDDWVERNELPSDIPLGEALSRLAARVDQVRTAVWANGVLLPLWLFQLGLMPDHPTLISIGIRVAISAFYAVALGWAIHARVRQVPVMQELILEGQRCFAGIPSPTD
ncbi:hypothetical protein ASF54_13105 [Frondihabitans sp. Leaf304]|nr:hypothetical protein ASF54_13105 [Frondihabitans sp. Leaf304]